MKLLNLGNTRNRSLIQNHILSSNNKSLINPDIQCSCRKKNLELHEILTNLEILGEFDGAIIAEEICDDEDSEGAEEAAIFNHSCGSLGLLRIV